MPLLRTLASAKYTVGLNIARLRSLALDEIMELYNKYIYTYNMYVCVRARVCICLFFRSWYFIIL